MSEPSSQEIENSTSVEMAQVEIDEFTSESLASNDAPDSGTPSDYSPDESSGAAIASTDVAPLAPPPTDVALGRPDRGISSVDNRLPGNSGDSVQILGIDSNQSASDQTLQRWANIVQISAGVAGVVGIFVVAILHILGYRSDDSVLLALCAIGTAIGVLYWYRRNNTSMGNVRGIRAEARIPRIGRRSKPFSDL